MHRNGTASCRYTGVQVHLFTGFLAAAMTGGLILGRSRPARRRPGFLREAEEGSDALITYAGDAHLLTIAPTGAGKGVGCVIPNALLYPGPLIVFDPKGEVYSVTRRQRERLGQKVVLLDVFRTTGQPADALNPLDLAGLIDPDRPEDAAVSMATLLTGGQLSHKDPFWDISAHAFITGLLTWLLTDCSPEERRFSRLYDLFSDSDLAYRLSGMLDSGEIRHRAAYAEIAAFLNHPERETRPSVQSTARQHLPLFGSGVVRRDGSHQLRSW